MQHPTPTHPTRPISSSLTLAASLILGLGCALLFGMLALAYLLSSQAR
jgi:hypothetical protein